MTLKTPVDEFREVRFFRRGHHHEPVEIKEWFGLRRRTIDALISTTTSCFWSR